MPSFRSHLVLCPLTFVGLVLLLGAEPARVLRYDGKTFDEWQEYVKSELKPASQAEGIKALIALGKSGRAKEAAATILDLVGEYDSSDIEAIPVFGEATRLGLLGRPVVPQLLDGLTSDKTSTKQIAWKILWPNDIYSIPATLEDGLKAEMPLLRQRAHGDDASIVRLHLAMIARWDATAPETVDLVLELLTSRNVEIRDLACNTLRKEPCDGGIRVDARKLIPLLIPLLKNDKTALSALEALKIHGAGAKDAVPLLIPLLKNDKTAWYALEALKIYGAAAKDAVPVLCRLLKNDKAKKPWYDCQVYQLLAIIGPEAKEAFLLLVEKRASLNREVDNGDLREIEEAMQSIDPMKAKGILGPKS